MVKVATLTNRQEAIRTGATRYFGKVCAKHPELNGERKLCTNKCVQCSRDRHKKYRIEHIENLRETKQKWFNNNRDRKKQSDAKYKSSLKLDPIKSLANRTRLLIAVSIKRNGFTKKSKAGNILGCSWEKFAAHIESQFVDGMSWANRSLWHIDHIIPSSSAKSESDVYKLNHFTNLRPLWAKENMSKGAKIEHR